MGLQDGNREQVTAAGQSNHGNDYEANKIATGTKLHIHIGGGREVSTILTLIKSYHCIKLCKVLIFHSKCLFKTKNTASDLPFASMHNKPEIKPIRITNASYMEISWVIYM